MIYIEAATTCKDAGMSLNGALTVVTITMMTVSASLMSGIVALTRIKGRLQPIPHQQHAADLRFDDIHEDDDGQQ